MNRERLKGHLDLLLLSVLAAGPAHGYAIITALRARSEGTFDLPEAPGRKRRVYALTGKGAAALAAEQARWRRFAAGMQAVVGWSA